MWYKIQSILLLLLFLGWMPIFSQVTFMKKDTKKSMQQYTLVSTPVGRLQWSRLCSEFRDKNLWSWMFAITLAYW